MYPSTGMLLCYNNIVRDYDCVLVDCVYWAALSNVKISTHPGTAANKNATDWTCLPYALWHTGFTVAVMSKVRDKQSPFLQTLYRTTVWCRKGECLPQTIL